jgi:NAD(P)-dependent dehydrogenase (short-subunit alcohol dehydrogenase family)
VLWFTYELQRRLPPRPVTANAVCPGFVPATAAASTRGAMRFVMQHVMPRMPFATSVREATDSLVFMAVDPSIEGVAEQPPLALPAHSLGLATAAEGGGAAR